MILTIEKLIEWDACNANKYREFIGDGVTIAGQVILAAQELGLLNANWLAEKILKAQAWAEYERVYWAIRDRVDSSFILHFTIATTRQDSWRSLFRLSSYRDNKKAQRRAKRLFKAVKIEIREVSK